MTSTSLFKWRHERSARLDKLMQAHVVVGGSGVGRRWATEELNHAIVLRLASEFQGFCRDLHNEAVNAIALAIANGDTRIEEVASLAYRTGRRLDRANADPVTLRRDFDLLGMSFWPDLYSQCPVKGKLWRQNLELLNSARNGLAHDDYDKVAKIAVLGWPLTLASVRRWRSSLDGLAVAMDRLVKQKVQDVWRTTPW